VNDDRYLIILEDAGTNFSAYSPDLPGCVATGKTLEQTRRRMRSAIRLHLQGLAEDGLPTPAPHAIAEYLAVV
jgi:predicted RNase H-like HicB family nuclease